MEALSMPGLFHGKKKPAAKGRIPSGRGRGSRPPSGRVGGGPERPESRASSTYGDDDDDEYGDGVHDSFKQYGERLSDRYVRRRLQKVPLFRKNYPQPGEEAIVGHWMIVDIEDTTKSKGGSKKQLGSRRGGLSLKTGPTIKDGVAGAAAAPETAEVMDNARNEKESKLKGALKGLGVSEAAPRTQSRKAMILEPLLPKNKNPNAAASPGGPKQSADNKTAMQQIFIFKPDLSSERLTDMSRALEEKERSRKALRDTELKRLDKLIRRNGADQPKLVIDGQQRLTRFHAFAVVKLQSGMIAALGNKMLATARQILSPIF
jgi:hypothetical protein